LFERICSVVVCAASLGIGCGESPGQTVGPELRPVAGPSFFPQRILAVAPSPVASAEAAQLKVAIQSGTGRDDLGTLHTALDSAIYGYNTANQRTAFTNAAGAYYLYYYDNIGQLKIADSSVNTEDRGYAYDQAWNVSYTTNNGSRSTFTVDNKNELTGWPYGPATYDGNGNRSTQSSGSSGISFAYDDENRLTTIYATSYYQTYFTYDGLGRLRQRSEYAWNGSTYSIVSTTQYIYDGNRVVQERDISNNPLVTYTRGTDLGGTLEGAGGIGGMLARSSGYSGGNWTTHHFYHADGNGNITYLVDANQALAASYRYDPFGSTISSSGTMAAANLYRFSSKEFHANSGMYFYLYRFYDPGAKRWPNRDPVEDLGFIILAQRITLNGGVGPNAYTFVDNNSIGNIDPHGLTIWYCSVPTSSFPTLGIGRHGYLWDDRPDTPPDKRECGQESSCGSGPHTSHNGGPGPGWGGAKPGTKCMPVDGSDGKEDAIMADCNAHANTGIWFPGINDCHNKARRCLKREGLTPPNNPRF
jgi:RHS repeat-associated protein